MKEYVLGVCFAMLFCVAVNTLIPQKRYGGIIKIVCGVFVVFTILSPLENILFSKFSLGDFFDANYDDWGFYSSIEESRKNFENTIKSGYNEISEEELGRELSVLTKENVSVKINVLSDSIVATVYGVGAKKHPLVKEYIKSNYGISVEFAG